MLTRIIIAVIMTVGLLFIDPAGWLRLALYLAVYLGIGYDILKKAWLGIIHGRVFDENILIPGSLPSTLRLLPVSHFHAKLEAATW